MKEGFNSKGKKEKDRKGARENERKIERKKEIDRESGRK